VTFDHQPQGAMLPLSPVNKQQQQQQQQGAVFVDYPTQIMVTSPPNPVQSIPMSPVNKQQQGVVFYPAQGMVPSPPSSGGMLPVQQMSPVNKQQQGVVFYPAQGMVPSEQQQQHQQQQQQQQEQGAVFVDHSFRAGRSETRMKTRPGQSPPSPSQTIHAGPFVQAAAVRGTGAGAWDFAQHGGKGMSVTGGNQQQSVFGWNGQALSLQGTYSFQQGMAAQPNTVHVATQPGTQHQYQQQPTMSLLPHQASPQKAQPRQASPLQSPRPPIAIIAARAASASPVTVPMPIQAISPGGLHAPATTGQVSLWGSGESGGWM